MKRNAKENMILCSGLQSGGTSLVSWCFLQRMDMDGVYDMENSIIHTDLSGIQTPYTWVKMTIGSFRTTDVKSVYEDLGYNVVPLLVIRDVRYAFASLLRKYYGINGNTAEDPPLRIRYRRFLEDWVQFRENNWPVLVFERFVQDPETELRAACASLKLPWDESMMEWNKAADSISYPSDGNRTLKEARMPGKGLQETLMQEKIDQAAGPIPRRELEWLEQIFSDYNRVNGYARHLESIPVEGECLKAPEYGVTTRKELLERCADTGARLERIRNHAVFGPLIRFWAAYINRDYHVF